jgi:hypothetical protein
LHKRRECFRGQIGLVEIDLLRGGRRHLIGGARLPQGKQPDYTVCIRRGWQPDKVEVYPVALQERLPTITIPLRQTDADAALNLQAVLDQCFRNGGYDDENDYQTDPIPKLNPVAARWLDALLRAEGRR